MKTHEVIGPLIVLVVSVALLVIWLLMHEKATRLAACRWRGRPPMDDDVFLKACEIPDEPLRIGVALAARRTIAELGTVPPETISPSDTFAHDLVELPFWDSLDWMGFILDIERRVDVKLPCTSVIDDAIKLAGGHHSKLQVKHVVKATALAATPYPKKPLFDEDW